MRQGIHELRERMCKERYKRKCAVDRSSEDESTSKEKRLTSTVSQENVAAKEAKNFAEGWISHGFTVSSIDDTGQFAIEIMQSAKKMVLVDEFDKEYKRLQRPVDSTAKTDRSLQLSDTLRDSSLSDDRKVREYIATLHRYLNTRKEVPEEPTVHLNTESLPVPPVTGPTRRRRRTQRQAWLPY